MKLFSIIYLFIIILLSINCISYRQQNDDLFYKDHIKYDNQKKASIIIVIEDEKLDLSQKNAIKKAYIDSRLFSKVEICNKNSINKFKDKFDIFVNCKFISKKMEYSNLHKCIFVFSLSWKTKNKITMETELKFLNGNNIINFQSTQTLGKWYNPFFFPFCIFLKSEKEIEKNAFYNLNKDFIIQAYKNGLFNLNIK